ncbi:MAG: GDSL-type esterase/lipase family protein [Opitutaceae bacterium]
MLKLTPLFSLLLLLSHAWLSAADVSLAPAPSASPSATKNADPAAAISTASSSAAVAPAVDPYWPADGLFPVEGKTSSWTGFRATNLRRRALFATQRAEDQNAIVFFGDSITEGWKTLTQDFAELGVKVANRGIGGDTTPNAVYRLQDDVLSLQPKAMVVLIGTNDLGEHTPPSQIAQNLGVLHQRIRTAYPAIPIAWCLVMPRRGSDTYPERIRDLNARIVELARSDPHSTVCDTFTPLALEDGSSKPEAFNPDRLHLNATGYATWRTALLPIVSGWKLPTK